MTPLQRGVVASLVASAIGAAAWTAISYGTDYGLGVLAILVGAASGIAMGHASGRRIGAPAGLLAAVFAFAAMLGGRYVYSQLVLRDLAAEATDFDRDDLVAHIAWTIYQEDPRRWDLEETEGEIPDALWAKAERSWDRLTSDEQEQYVEMLLAKQQAAMEESAPILNAIALLYSIGFGGLFCMATGVVLAYRFGAAVVEADPEVLGAVAAPARTGAPARDPGRPSLSGLPGLPAPGAEPDLGGPAHRRDAA